MESQKPKKTTEENLKDENIHLSEKVDILRLHLVDFFTKLEEVSKLDLNVDDWDKTQKIMLNLHKYVKYLKKQLP